ncbi:hypothetical protein BBO99_00006253 [Phytophthora kernoviae]|uniref:Uncharacterized protein n=1 Tax=Phytophthora kernoviae TaxID=325452 RepID=A0A421GLS1_9STRA|nr:hypothetical protein BBI17_006363 [Phytophthora kernoviae]RLN78039.1 hypothetical protein BBO99_00006253 [Phytophthora kernoviae]
MEALNNIFNEARGSGEEGLCQDAPLSTNTEMDGVKQENEHELEDAGDNGVEFVGMLEHLSGGEIEFLALKAEDLTVRRLERPASMVHIINGEIVADDDPRVRARMQPQTQAQTQPQRRFGSVHDSPGAPATAGAAPPPPAAAAGGGGQAQQQLQDQLDGHEQKAMEGVR